jgi:hypothetical protein
MNFDDAEDEVAEDMLVMGMPLKARQAQMAQARAILAEKRARGQSLLPRFSTRRKRTAYMRKSILRFLEMTPTEFEKFAPETMLQSITKDLFMAAKNGRAGVIAVQVWKEVKETLGERIGSNWKETKEHNEGKPDIINDLPSAEAPPSD